MYPRLIHSWSLLAFSLAALASGHPSPNEIPRVIPQPHPAAGFERPLAAADSGTVAPGFTRAGNIGVLLDPSFSGTPLHDWLTSGRRSYRRPAVSSLEPAPPPSGGRLAPPPEQGPSDLSPPPLPDPKITNAAPRRHGSHSLARGAVVSIPSIRAVCSPAAARNAARAPPLV